MNPATAEGVEELELVHLPEEEDEELDDEDEEDDDELDDEDDDEDEDDAVATDEDGKEMLRTQGQDPQQAPDVSSDRVPATDAEPEGSLDRVRSGPLGITEIVNMADDSRGG